MNANEAGKKFLDDVIGKIPEDRRAELQTIAEAHPELLEAIGAGTLRLADYSRVRDEQTNWFEASRQLLELGQKAKDAGFDPSKPPTVPAPVPAADVVSREDFDRASRDVAGFVLESNFLQAQHLKEFGEPINLLELAKDPRVPQLGLRGVYEATVAPKREERMKAATEAEITRRVDEQVKERMKGVHHPSFPSGAVPAGSPLDALEPIKSTGPDVQELTDMYEELVSQSGGR